MLRFIEHGEVEMYVYIHLHVHLQDDRSDASIRLVMVDAAIETSALADYQPAPKSIPISLDTHVRTADSVRHV